MKWYWDGTKCGKWHNGTITWKYIWDIFIQFKKDSKDEYEKDSIYFLDESWVINQNRDKKYEEKARYLKYCCEIIENWKRKNKECKFLIMSRTNSTPFPKEHLVAAYFLKLMQQYPDINWESEEVLLKKKNIEESITMQTVHKSKWAEADICILLQVWRSKWKSKAKFPFLHPDYPFWIIFWDIPSSLLEEERRLYYVALTRTKQDLYFISESETANLKSLDEFLISSFNEWVSTIKR